METWNELTVKVATSKIDAASDICTMIADQGIYVEDYSKLESDVWDIAHVDLIEKDLLEKDRGHCLIHIYIKSDKDAFETKLWLSEMLKSASIENEISIVGVNEEDWANGWKQYYHVQHIGKNIVVVPSWEKYEPKNNEVIMTLDPGMAFGTGTHETTRLCLELLEGVVSGNKNILDIGTGSGILAVGGLLLGAKSALGVDIDPVAVKTADENAKINGVNDKTKFLCGDLTDKVSGSFEIVTANIVADVIIRLLDTVKNYLISGGDFIISGIIDTRGDEVQKACEDAGFKVINRLELNGWVAMHLK